MSKEQLYHYNDTIDQLQQENEQLKKAYWEQKDKTEHYATLFENKLTENFKLKQQLAEERKFVCSQLRIDIRSLFNSYASSLIDYCIWNKNADANQKLYNNFKRIINDRLIKVLDLFDKRIDQIERGDE